MSSEWIAVSERLPEDGQRILLWVRNPKDVAPGYQMKMGTMRFGELQHDSAGGNWHDSYSHWMPLPAPPESEQP